MTSTLPAIPPAVMAALKFNTVVFSRRRQPPSDEIAHFRLVELIGQRRGLRNDLRDKSHKQFPQKRIEEVGEELLFLDHFLGETEELRLDNERIAEEDPIDPPAPIARVAQVDETPEDRFDREFRKQTSPLKRLALCIRHSFVGTENMLPSGLNDRAAEIAHGLVSYRGINPSKTLHKLVEAACLFYQEIRELGIGLSTAETDALIECRELTA